MNNKVLGTQFERELCDILKEKGMWVHFLSPDNRGAQPFDIIAVANNIPIAIDCKTSARSTFPITRLEDNQIFAFNKWLDCGNEYAVIAVKYKEKIYFIDYQDFLSDCYGLDCGKSSVKLEDCCRMDEWLEWRSGF